ncbi:DUF6801 domain-containing protein [Streptomyces sp. NPDC048560]|uniref:DUF6801 domain-containing protein n=1 Tax=Streptomyces sp. NPDC048560 TaxID=3155488 RepID=UPI003444EE9F
MTVDPRAAARRPLHLAVGGALVVATALIPSTESAAAPQESEVLLSYTCSFPSGTEEVAVRVSAELPSVVRTGAEIQPEDVTVEVDVPASSLRQFVETEAATFSTVAELTVRNAQGDESADAAWKDLKAEPVAVPAEGAAVVVATGDVPMVSFGSPGRATMAPAALSLDFTPLTAEGAATTPPGLAVRCEPTGGEEGEQEGVLGEITVRGPADPVVPGPATPGPAPLPEDPPPAAGPGLPPSVRERIEGLTERRLDALDDEPPASCPVEIPPEWVMTTAEAYAAGYANAAKLDGATALGPAFMKVVLNKRYIADGCASTIDVTSAVDFDHQGKRQLPPSRATFLTYGFMPTTATMTLEQVGDPAHVHSHTVTDSPAWPEETTITAQLSMRLSDVEVNGVPLDVGPDCRTARPFEQVLRGYGQSYPRFGYLVAFGGPLTGYAHIPPFEGCGVGEDLDAVFTAAVSSAGKEADNFTKMMQAPLCVATNPDVNCPPAVPKPER